MNKKYLQCIYLVFFLLLGDCSSFCFGSDTIVFSLKNWEGVYETSDIPGGVQSTPASEEIYTIQINGKNLRKVVSIPGAICTAPVYSPDAQWIYFQSNAKGQTHLFRCKPDGSGLEQLTSGEFPGAPWQMVYGLQLTKKGNILCTVYDGQKGAVALLDPESKKIKIIAPQLGYLYMSAISPDEKSVIASGPASGYRLWLLNLPEAFQTGDKRITQPALRLAPEHPESFVPQFTPDGETIVYLRRDGDLYRVNLDRTKKNKITNGNKYVEFRLSPKDKHGSTDGPHLSPDGQKIAFLARRNGIPQVCRINLDGSGFKQLTDRNTPCGRVKWSPDGRWISFVSFVNDMPQLFFIGANGNNPEQVTRLKGAVYFHNWKPAVE